jgi:septal ring factor EnvC (AmiA/AmiB activator)
MSFSGKTLTRSAQLAALSFCMVSPLSADPGLRGTDTNESLSPNPSVATPRDGAPKDQPPKDGVDARQLELQDVQGSIEQSEAERRKIQAEIETMRNDHARLSAALLETTQKANAGEQKMIEAEHRISTLAGNEDAIKRSLESRRAVIAEVLASLQRMSRRPPPALFVAPEDMLQAIRTSMLLGAVLPEMRAETAALATDLADLIKLRASIAAEREGLEREAASLKEEHARLAALIEARQAALSTAEQTLSTERDRAQDLARQATNLKDLIGKMESEVAAAAHAAESARAADDARKRTAELEPGVKQKFEGSPFKDPARLSPAIAFADAKGLLPLPAAGTPLRGFGAPDGLGGSEKGLLLETRTQAVVASPCDGWIAYAGPYRTYGQLLIVNAGQGYYVILAGMDRVNVNVGQFILAGEPVAVMGDGSAKTAAAIAIGAAQPILYVEFRKDGTAIDPGPWWAKPEMQRVRG